MSKTSKIILITIIMTSILLGLGYAAIQNITLNIAGTAVADPNQSNFKVKFTGTPAVSDSTYVTANITGDTTATINVNGLTKKGQKVTATYEISNLSSDLSSDLNVAVSNSNTEYFFVSSKLEKTSLTAGEKTTVLVTVELTKTPIDGDVSSNIGVTMNAMPVEPGNEGSSEGINDYSEAPRGLNEYGFYFGKAYSTDGENGKVGTIVFYEDGSMDIYQDGYLMNEFDAGKAIYGYEFIDISKLVNGGKNDDGILVVYSDGKQLVSNTNVVLNLDENFFDNCKVRNEYGFYYGEAYSTSIDGMKITYIFYEDGSMETYCDGVFGGCGDSGYAQYEYKKIDLDGLLFEVVGFGTEMFNGERYYELDYDFWKPYQNMETEMNEYGFYYGEAYSYFVLRNEIRSVVFYEDGSIKYYRNNELELSQPSGSIGYGYKWMRTTEDQIFIDISDNGRILTKYADTPPDMIGLDPTFWERNGLVKPN